LPIKFILPKDHFKDTKLKRRGPIYDGRIAPTIVSLGSKVKTSKADGSGSRTCGLIEISGICFDYCRSLLIPARLRII
jgi:hypothetical protein